MIENALFGGNDLKDEDSRRPTKSKLNSIFDYDDDSDEEQKKTTNGNQNDNSESMV